MFLTKMPINRRRRAAGKLLSYPQAMHAAVESCFPPGVLDTAGGRALWRVDTIGGSAEQSREPETNLYIVSPAEPDLSHIVEQAGWQTGSMWQTRDYRPLLDDLCVGRKYAFRLRANPVKSVRPNTSVDTKLTALQAIEHQEEWLVKRAATCGFTVPKSPEGGLSLRVIERGTMRFGKGNSGGRSKSQVTLGFATYEGVLEVGDADLLRTALINGIGRAKAYGCGLMTLAPRAR